MSRSWCCKAGSDSKECHWELQRLSRQRKPSPLGQKTRLKLTTCLSPFPSQRRRETRENHRCPSGKVPAHSGTAHEVALLVHGSRAWMQSHSTEGPSTSIKQALELGTWKGDLVNDFDKGFVKKGKPKSNPAEEVVRQTNIRSSKWPLGAPNGHLKLWVVTWISDANWNVKHLPGAQNAHLEIQMITTTANGHLDLQMTPWKYKSSSGSTNGHLWNSKLHHGVPKGHLSDHHSYSPNPSL